MTPSRVRIARDYNRSLPGPVRWAHMAAAVLATAFGPAVAWLRAPARRDWAWPLALGVVGVLIFLPLDGPITKFFNTIRLGGDVRREAEWLQQYGQLSSIVITIILILLLDTDRARVRRILDWIAAAVAALVVVNLVKMTVGRPRPKFDDPWGFIGPLGVYPIPNVGLRHAWEFWRGISSDLWSMPSSHTAYAVVMSVALAALYPRLRIFAIVMAVLVGLCRVLVHAHYPSDVIAGAALGSMMAMPAMRQGWGRRILTRN